MRVDLNALTKQITHGVYVIGVTDGQHRNAFTAAWLMQVSFKPLLLAFSINPQHYSYRLLKATGVCCVNVLAKNQLDRAAHFGRADKDKMHAYQWQSGKLTDLILTGSSAFFECKVSHYVSAGDHELVICVVANADFLTKAEPLLYKETADMDESSQLLPAQL